MIKFLGDRKSPRFEVKKNIVLENSATGVQHDATMKDFSGDGLKCESKIPYKSGTIVIARINNWPNDSSNKCYLGEVRWCNRKKGDESSLYDVGIHIQSIFNN